MRKINIQGIEVCCEYIGLRRPDQEDIKSGLRGTYEITLYNPATQQSFNFPFYDSFWNTEKKLGSCENDPVFLSSILECIDSDLNSEDGCSSFESYCSNYGFDNDSIIDFTNYENTKRHIEGLQRVLSIDFENAVYSYSQEDDEYGVGLILNPASNTQTPNDMRSTNSSCWHTTTSEYRSCDDCNPIQEESNWQDDYQKWVDGGRK